MGATAARVKGGQMRRSTHHTLIHNAVTSPHNNARLCSDPLLLRRWPLPMPRSHRLPPYR
jgi:hypothetical protein